MSSPPGASSSHKNGLLDVLSDVKTRMDELGIVVFPVPQFILIGSQSVGKSRLMETLAGEQFNISSGSLGSRRPTVLEFRNVATAHRSMWYVQDRQTNRLQHYPAHKVLEIVCEAHNSLGTSVSQEPINVRVESAQCVDMQIVDLPGYRSSGDDAAQIEELNRTFLSDERNVVLCVEEAGDEASLAALRRVSEADPGYKRTILIRSKLDKCFGDLNSDNVNGWLEGFGDLKALTKFALTLPHWTEGEAPPKKLAELHDECDKRDLNMLEQFSASKEHLEFVGFGNFSKFMEKRTEKMFLESIEPVLTKLRHLEESMSKRELELKEELEQSDPASLVATVRACGTSFARCLTHVMEGVTGSDINRMYLKDELMEFHRYLDSLGDSSNLPSVPTEYFCREAYIQYLEKVPDHIDKINGGAQFRRLMLEVEIFVRFSEIEFEAGFRNDVRQSCGHVSMGSVTWREVVGKILVHRTHLPLQRKIAYVGERVKWFFGMQKDAILQFMICLKGSPEEKLYSVLYSKHAKMMQENTTVKKLVFDMYDNVVDRQLQQFMELFKNALLAMFSNPWAFLKKATQDSLDDVEWQDLEVAPCFEEEKDRVVQEIESRTGIERAVTKWLHDIPSELHKVDEAVDLVESMLRVVHSKIRSQVCDQVELFVQSFFKIPLMLRLEEDMDKVELSEVDKEGCRVRREKLSKEAAANIHALKEVRECLKVLQGFTTRST